MPPKAPDVGILSAAQHLASVKVGRRRLITRQHLQQFLEIAS